MPFDGTPHLFKPEGIWDVDRGHPLARGLGGLVVFEAGGPVNLLNGVRGSLAGTATIERRKPGQVLIADATDEYADLPDTAFGSTLSSPTNYTVMMLWKAAAVHTSWASSSGVFVKRSSGTSGSYGLYRNGASDPLVIQHSSSGNFDTGCLVSNFTADFRWFATVRSGTNQKCYLDRTKTADVTYTTTPLAGTASLVFNTARDLGSEGRTEHLVWIMWRRALDEAELFALQDDPWQLLTPMDGLWVPAFKAAGGTTFNQALSATANPAVAGSRRVGKLATAASSPMAESRRSVTKSLTGGATSTATVAKRIGKALGAAGAGVAAAIASFVGALILKPARVALADGAAVACAAASVSAISCAASDAPTARAIGSDSAVA